MTICAVDAEDATHDSVLRFVRRLQVMSVAAGHRFVLVKALPSALPEQSQDAVARLGHAVGLADRLYGQTCDGSFLLFGERRGEDGYIRILQDAIEHAGIPTVLVPIDHAALDSRDGACDRRCREAYRCLMARIRG